MIAIPELVRTAALEHRYPLLFATVSGAHLYGFPSPDSDWDLRGIHILPAKEVVGLFPIEETIEVSHKQPIEIDLVTHDIHKFFKLLLRPNGYVLEQLLSPIVVYTTPEHKELVSLAPGCLTRHHAHHYLGFANNQWSLFRKEQQPRIKPLLYSFRVLLTGIHLMRTGTVEANLIVLNEEYKLPFLTELLRRKIQGAEKETLASADIEFYEGEFQALRDRLVAESQITSLPDAQTAQAALNDLLIRVRLNGYGFSR
jgi:predicted nucleotidyltransferase